MHPTSFALALLLFAAVSFAGVLAVSVKQDDDATTATTDAGLSVVVSGKSSVPKFTIFATTANSTSVSRYKIQLTSMYQTASLTNRKSLPASSTAAASLKWAFSTVSTEPSGHVAHFNMSTQNAKSGPSYNFAFHVSDSAGLSVKYDTIIDGVQDSFWVPTAKYLAVCFRFLQQGSGDSAQEQDASLSAETATLNVGRVYFGSGLGASVSALRSAHVVGGSTVDSDLLPEDNSKNSACVYYGRFLGSIVHDPTFTIESAPQFPWLAIGLLGLGAGAVIILATAVACGCCCLFCISRRKKSDYQTF